MSIDFLFKVFNEHLDKEFIVWKDKTYNYRWLVERYNHWKREIDGHGIPQGSVTIIEADFSPNSIALFLALVDNDCIVVPLTSAVKSNKKKFISIAQGEYSIAIDSSDHVQFKTLSRCADHVLIQKLRNIRHPGLILFSSGTTGESKAAVHDLNKVLEKFRVPRSSMKSVVFLLFDHIGGINTMLYNLSNAGCMVAIQKRTPDNVLQYIEKYGVELLPTSPTFINLVLLSEAYKRYDLSSLKTVTYGTEPMSESTLKRFHALFPAIKLQQTYGLSELGILRSKSKSSDSLWVKIGGEGFHTRIVDNTLHIKAASAMMGYLNAPSPFTRDGWFPTGDAVEVNGDYIRIIARKSDIINVGGEKVYPSEVESVIQEMHNVAEVTVYGEKNPILGNIVCAIVRLSKNGDHKSFIGDLKKFCRKKLEAYKVPVKIRIEDEKQYSERFKKRRVKA
jgi:acyl-CoA synthetase (AMP-forming)/AMP-acid ligase II